MYTYYRCNSEGFEIITDGEPPQAVPENVSSTSDLHTQINVLNSFYDVDNYSKYMSEKDFTNSKMPSVVTDGSEEHTDSRVDGSGKDVDNSEQDSERSQMSERECFDSRLMEASSEAMACGSLMPLIKEELKLSIQTKRLKEGKGEMKVDFTTPQPYMLTEEEVQKVKKRRVQNRDAARRFRDRQKSKGSVLQKECQKLESQNTQLRYIATQLRDERNKLRARFEAHARLCPYSPPQPFYTPMTQDNDT